MIVKDEFRTNPLSFEPGGHTVVVKEVSGKVFEYTKVKYPNAYIKKLLLNPQVAEAWVQNEK